MLILALKSTVCSFFHIDCPSSTWVQFQDSCYIFLQEAIKVESIEDVRNQCTDHGADMVSIHNEEENAFILDTLQNHWKGPDDLLLGMFYDTDDASFKWFDNSNMTFDKWADQEDGEDLVDTCGFLYTKTGEWKKGNCEVSSVEGTLCKAAMPYDKKYLSDCWDYSCVPPHPAWTFLIPFSGILNGIYINLRYRLMFMHSLYYYVKSKYLNFYHTTKFLITIPNKCLPSTPSVILAY
uniref:CD302 antigen n=1 Tax=Castor canadensis TaxID=51338 RepID=A0A8B7TR88_CASCN|nr:CD302 antigen isoform X1 [Castor canadensis]